MLRAAVEVVRLAQNLRCRHGVLHPWDAWQSLAALRVLNGRAGSLLGSAEPMSHGWHHRLRHMCSPILQAQYYASFGTFCNPDDIRKLGAGPAAVVYKIIRAGGRPRSILGAMLPPHLSMPTTDLLIQQSCRG